jgi:hypothetical protein
MQSEKVFRMKCHDCGAESDPAYTMDFSDIGMPPIYWCTPCGKLAQAMNDLLTVKLNQDPNFKSKFARAVSEAEEWGPLEDLAKRSKQ